MQKQMLKFAAAAVVLLVAVSALFATLAPAPAGAAAATQELNTPQRTGDQVALTQGSNQVWAGTMVALDSNGLALPAANTSGLKVVGRAFRSQDNTGTRYLATRRLLVDRGVFAWGNGSNVFTQANITDVAYVMDDSNVSTTNNATNAIAAGRIVDVDTANAQVWVDTRVR